ncbi:MAG: type II toxin-antitoxin system Phd/YefM family antitoxin [Acidobacteriota bacterium]|nr:type II toxin-antitoxin system Phd/YefM family antitoxin [Acidobacteriota bacterium]
MKNAMTPTELRKDLYRILDEVLDTGVPQQVLRGERRLMIVPAGGSRLRLAQLPRRQGLACTPEELIATSWEREWNPEP